MAAQPAIGPVRIRRRLPGRIRLELIWLRRARTDLVASLKDGLESMPGVKRVTIAPVTGSVLVEFEAQAITSGAIERAVQTWHAGARVPTRGGTVPTQAEACIPCATPRGLRTREREAFQPRDLPLTAQIFLTAVAGVISIGMMLKIFLFGRSRFAASNGIFTIAALTTILSGYPIFRAGLEGLTVERKLNNDLLISVASLVAVVLKESWTGLAVIFLINLSNLFQTLTLDRSRRAIRQMLTGDDRKASIIVDGAEVEVPVEQVQVGDVVIIRTGEKAVIDGRVVHGDASVNQAPITGESVPVTKHMGDEVYAGSIVELGYLHVQAEKVGDDTTVGRIIHLVEEASAVKAPIQNLAERFADRFVPVSLFAATAFFLITWDVQLTLTILIIACPCAAGLSTPTAVSAALGNAAGRGMLVKGGNYLETMGHVDTVLFDKTGTVTEGRPEVTDVVAVGRLYDPEDVLVLAAAAEVRSTHPLARAVLKAAQAMNLVIPEVEEHQVIVGRGVRATLHGYALLAGSWRLMEEAGILTSHLWPHVAELEQQGRSVLLVAYAGRLVGLVAVADRLRPESPEAVRMLDEVGVDLVGLLTGDSRRVGDSVGSRLGVDQVWAELLPEQKRDVVQSLQQNGRRVVMVGEGINDSPALAAADVGIALGTGGTDVAIEAADIVLAGDDPRKVAGLVRLSRRTLQVIHQNFAFAVGINSIGLLMGLTRMISPLTGALLHNLATLGVVMNSSRILFYTDWDATEAPQAGAHAARRSGSWWTRRRGDPSPLALPRP